MSSTTYQDYQEARFDAQRRVLDSLHAEIQLQKYLFEQQQKRLDQQDRTVAYLGCLVVVGVLTQVSRL